MNKKVVVMLLVLLMLAIGAAILKLTDKSEPDCKPEPSLMCMPVEQ